MSNKYRRRKDEAVHPDVVGKIGLARPLGGRPAGWETRETAAWEVCGTKNPPTTLGCTGRYTPWSLKFEISLDFVL
jgi:hypothetical protein